MRPTTIIRGVAAFDLLVTAVFAVPPLAKVFVQVVYALDGMISGGDVAAVAPAIPPIAWLFFNVAGILGVLWAGVRIVMPMRELAIADAAARCVVAAWVLYYCLAESVPSILLVFVATEVLGSLIQGVAIRRFGIRSTILGEAT